MSNPATTTNSVVVEMGERLLAEKITPEIEQRNFGKIVAIDVDTGQFVIGETPVECWQNLQSPPGARLFTARVGGDALYHFGSFAKLRKP